MIKPYLTNPNMLVPYYLMFSYAYYKENESLISDSEYDQICQDLITNWDNITHWHKPLLSLESLKAGTGYDIAKYPNRVVSAALSLIKENTLNHSEMD
jgi:NAD-dependent DNA ligase